MQNDAIRRRVRQRLAAGDSKPAGDKYPVNPDADELPAAKKAPAVDPPPAGDDEPWQAPIPFDCVPAAAAFPLDVLPGPLRSFVDESAWALNCPPDYLAVPLLSLTGAAIGARRRLEIKPGWRELPSLYCAVVGPPGSAKTPALKLTAAPFYAAQATRHKAWQGERQAWQEADEQGTKPTLETVFVSDCTTEALAGVLQDNPCGVALIRDELTAWVGALDQYRARGRGADRQFYLSAWAGEPVSVHRKNQDEGPLFVPHPFLCVVGGLPPDCLEKLRGERGARDGFLDRVLFTYPKPPPAVGETWRAVPDESQAAWSEALAFLWALKQDLDGQTPRPRIVYLDTSGRHAWERFTNELAGIQNAPDLADALAGPLAKMRGFGARLALIVRFLHLATKQCEGEIVTGPDVDKAAALVRYFQSHAAKVYAAMGTDGDGDRCQRILAWIGSKRVSQFKGWEAFKGCKSDRLFPRQKDLDGPLDMLVRHRCLRRQPVERNASGGRPPDPWFLVNPMFQCVGKIAWCPTAIAR